MKLAANPKVKNALKNNLEKFSRFHKRFIDEGLPIYIDGLKTFGEGKRRENLCPINNKPLSTWHTASLAQLHKAVDSSEKAFASWKLVSGKERQRILRAIADGIEARAEEIAILESMDTGQPIRFMSKAAQRGAENFRFFADKASEASGGKSMPTATHLNYSVREPIGPVVAITPWNTPFMLATWKIAPALAAGCTVLHKPSELSPLSSILLCEIMLEAGLPPGVCNLIHGEGQDIGSALVSHKAMHAVAFVGSSHTGKSIMRQAADSLKHLHFELGGKNPVIVFRDADMQRALDAVIFMIFSLNGERCTSSSRLLVEASIYEEFIEKVRQRIEHIVVGHPLDPATELGPLISVEHFNKVCSYFQKASDEKADTPIGGKAHALHKSEGGNYVEPTLFTHANQSMAIAREEIFGPVLTAIAFKDEAEALQVACDVEYGLTAYVWTCDMGRGLRMANGLRAGMVWLNSENKRHLPAPFGGMKQSGLGRDGGDYSFDFYMETKNICLAHNSHSIPQLGVKQD